MRFVIVGPGALGSVIGRSLSGVASSMLQDLDAQRPTEVDAIHGAVLDAGEETGITTPATHVIAALIRAQEKIVATMEHADGE
jgi:ketopantoate reductase